MLTPDFTPVAVVDREHIEELKITLVAWRRFCPEIYNSKWCIIADDDVYDDAVRLGLGEVHPLISPFGWPQRERALSAFVKQVPYSLNTPYFLKVDTDCFPTKRVAIPKSEWFIDDPVFISSPWGYTKPNNAIEKLDDWGDTCGMRLYPRLDLPYDMASNKICHSRIISYLYFGRTDWHREVADKVTDRLPVPSQDTLTWYVAARTRQKYLTVKFKRLGFAHVGRGGERLRAAVSEAMDAG